MMVNKEDLRDVLFRNVEDAVQSNFEFAFGRLISEENLLPNFEIEDLGIVNVPVSIKDLNRLKKISEAAYCCHENIKMTGTGKLKKNSWKLDATHIRYQSSNAETFFRHTVFSLAKDGLRQLGVVAKELNFIDVVQTGMLILERGGYAPIHCDDNEREPGLFGLMTIQVPVKNGYEGGILKVNHQGQCRMFDNSNSSKTSFYTTIFYAGCEHELTEVTNGWRLVFTFSLIWKWTRSLFVPITDTSLMFTANEIERILSPWRLPCSQRCVAIPLEHNYSSANLSFSGLKGRDRLTASLLRSVNFIDLHLASVHSRIKLSTTAISSMENSLEPQIEQEYYTGHWVASCTDSPFKFQGLEIDFDSEVIYPMFRRSQINLDSRLTEWKNLTSHKLVDVHQIESSMKYIYCKALLVVWPKTSTIDLACAYGFVGALDLLEYLVRTTPAEEVLFVLGRTVAFCCANPRLVWRNSSHPPSSQPVPLPGHVTYRLFQLCIDLNAPEQGLIILNLISEDFPTSPTKTALTDYQSDAETKEIEGLQNNQVANALAKLIAMTGWNSCKEAVSRFLTPVRIAQQMEALTVLVTSLMGYEGLHINATYIADQLCPILFTSPSCWKSSTCKTAAEMIFRLEGRIESSNSQRIADYFKFAQSIQTGFLCSVIVYIHQKLMQLTKQNPHLEEFCRELCQVLVQRDLVSLRLVSEKNELIIIDVLKCFLSMNNHSIILQQFVEKVTMPTRGNNVCLQALLASSSIWKVCLATEHGKQILLVLIDCRLKELSLLQPPIFSWQQLEAQLPNCPEVENFLRSSKLSANVSQKFLNINQAHNWVFETFGSGIEVLSQANSQFCVNHRFSATIRLKKVAGGLFVCEMTKNRLLHEYDVGEFKSKQQEIYELIERRRVELSDDPSTRPNKRVKFHFS